MLPRIKVCQRAEAERVASLEGQYPWDDATLEQAWQSELDVLCQAVKAASDAEAADRAREFLLERQARRALPGMTSSLVDYERKREWLEGSAKYAELALGLTAARSDDYQPVAAMDADPDFKAYGTQERFWSQQVREVKNARRGEIRFYYSGMAQASLLDRLMPGWKMRAVDEDVWLDVLLAEAVFSVER